jgi:hypothetical protein
MAVPVEYNNMGMDFLGWDLVPYNRYHHQMTLAAQVGCC